MTPWGHVPEHEDTHGAPLQGNVQILGHHPLRGDSRCSPFPLTPLTAPLLKCKGCKCVDVGGQRMGLIVGPWPMCAAPALPRPSAHLRLERSDGLYLRSPQWTTGGWHMAPGQSKPLECRHRSAIGTPQVQYPFGDHPTAQVEMCGFGTAHPTVARSGQMRPSNPFWGHSPK